MEPIIKKAESTIRKTFKLKVQKPEVDRLKTFAQVLPDEMRSEFKIRYGKILDLLNVNVQIEAISALAQYYDSPLRCFTFSNFQLAPTIEEFAQIIGQPLTKGKPYHFQENYPLVETVAKALGVNANQLNNKKVNVKTLKGIPRVQLEELMNSLVRNKNWNALIDVLALAVYDLVLFPSAGELVGVAAMDVFMARKCRGENSAFALLADVYYTMTFCHEKKGKRIVCCVPVLYVWLTTHVFRRGYESYCPVVDLRRLRLKTQNAKEWAQVFVGLKEESVRWYPQWMGTEEVIYRCGEFPNVPLMGTLGCINYNPTLALRQLCYPIMGPPDGKAITPFMTDLKDKEMLNRIRRAWGRVVRKGKELGRRSCGATDNYKQWVRDRVEQIKLPFQKPDPSIQPETNTVLEECKEIKEVKDKLVKLETEKCMLEAELKEVRSSFEALIRDYGEKAQLLERANKRARTERVSMDRTKVCLRSANRELGLRNAERNRVVRENEQLRKILMEMRQQMTTFKGQMEEQANQHEMTRKIDEQAFLEAIGGYQEHLEKKHEEIKELSKEKEELIEENWKLKGDIMNLELAQAEAQQCLNSLAMQMEERTTEYEQRIRNDKQEVRSVIKMYRATIAEKNEEIRVLGQWSVERNHYIGMIRNVEENYSHAQQEADYWARKLKKIERIPELVQNADATVNPLTTPQAVIKLIDTCKELVEEVEKLVKRNREN